MLLAIFNARGKNESAAWLYSCKTGLLVKIDLNNLKNTS
jgi:hypothetical protein